MQRGRLLLLLTGIGAVICSIWILAGFIAPETQNLAFSYSMPFIVRSHGVDFMVGCLVALGILILLVARIQPRRLPWLTAMGLGAAITAITFPISTPHFFTALVGFKGIHTELYGAPFGWLIRISHPKITPHIRSVLILPYLIDLILWSLVAKVLLITSSYLRARVEALRRCSE